MKPFLKWAGGKYRQMEQIKPHLVGNRLIEPFVGAGSVFLNAGFERVVINDINSQLTNLYRAISEHGLRVLEEGKALVDRCRSDEEYRKMRDDLNNLEKSDIEKAILFLAINRTCFNGLCRYNRKGGFNVPWGKYAEPYFPAEEIRAFMDSGIKPVILNEDFEKTMVRADSGDVIFCDPPYEPMPESDGFTNYFGQVFNWTKQEALASVAKMLSEEGIRTVITNSSAPRLVELYRDLGFTINPLVARRSISAKGDTRGRANDIIAVIG